MYLPISPAQTERMKQLEELATARKTPFLEVLGVHVAMLEGVLEYAEMMENHACSCDVLVEENRTRKVPLKCASCMLRLKLAAYRGWIDLLQGG